LFSHTAQGRRFHTTQWLKFIAGLAQSLCPYAMRALPRIEAIHYHMVEGCAVTAGHDLHRNKPWR
jgi:hypothetical protein